jgi:hypothetical protein
MFVDERPLLTTRRICNGSLPVLLLLNLFTCADAALLSRSPPLKLALFVGSLE